MRPTSLLLGIATNVPMNVAAHTATNVGTAVAVNDAASVAKKVVARIVVALAIVFIPTVSRSADQVDYSRDVRPILSQHCFQCHGPDDAVRKGKLRLDVRSAALAPGASGKPAVVPGKPEAAELIARIRSHDRDEQMPPASTKKPLSEAQKATLERWIKEGAEYAEHWSFRPLVAPKLPTVKNEAWARNAVDLFILSRLEKAKIRPADEADRYTLIRRLYQDLIGVPPTPEEADRFMQDRSPDAYERLVDRLLDSPHYGERWARRWLDLARYADTNGYEKDRRRTMWLYRDWVIRAINSDMRFDRFTIAQLAGDMLTGATDQDRIATGFHRNTMLNEEGGADPLEFRWHAVNDRVATTGTTWLGLTLNCCQCHNHKYDPISQKDYYGFFALLNNADEPTVDIADVETDRRRRSILAEIAAAESKLAGAFPGDREAAFRKWLEAERSSAVAWRVLQPASLSAEIPSLLHRGEGIIIAAGDLSKRDVYRLKFRSESPRVTAIRIEALPDPILPAGGPGRTSYEGPFGDFFLSEAVLTQNDQAKPWASASASYFDPKGKPEGVIDGNPLTGWSVNGGQGKAHQLVLNLKEPMAPGEFQLDLVFEKYFAAGLGKLRVSVADVEKPVSARGLDHAENEAILTAPETWSAADRKLLEAKFLSVAAELAPKRAEIKKLRDSLPAYTTALVMRERPAEIPRPTFLHRRGEFTQPTERIGANVPKLLEVNGTTAVRNRLDFARYLVDPNHPLTWRVTVNREWSAFFGRGIVRTLEDFGLQGEPPSHPELLDYLARFHAENGGARKELHRLIVTSATYRQSSRFRPEVIESDPAGSLRARGPRFRLEAELIRDQALAVSGLLTAKIGGPSVFPPQPPGVSSEGAYGPLAWNVSVGPDRYRRGLYTFAKRTAPYAMFQTFDGPSGEACVARRELSNTPLQALTTLNDAVFMEAAAALGKWASESPGEIGGRADAVWRRILTRPPTADESATIRRFVEQRLANKAPGSDLAAWTALARCLLNLDEVLTRE